MTELEMKRLEDFKRILTYHLVAKIHHHFKDNYMLYYQAPSIWAKWRSGRCGYDKRIYKLIIMFNDTCLSKHQAMHIFGKSGGKYLHYSQLIEQDPSIKTFNKGSIFMNNRRFQLKKRYQLPLECIKPIFDDKELLNKVLDAGSGYYTDRQRRLIFTQINDTKKNYHYKTNQHIAEDMDEQKMIDVLLDEIDGGTKDIEN